MAPRKRIVASQVTGMLKQAQAFQTQGRFNDAIGLCEEIFESGFDRPDARYFLGWLYQEQRRWREAIQQFQKLLNDSDYALSCYYGIGQCYRALGDLRTAVVHFDEAVDRVNLDALTIEEVDQLIQLCQESAQTHHALGEQEHARDVYNALLGLLRLRGWNNKVAEVELILQQMRDVPKPIRPVTPPPTPPMENVWDVPADTPIHGIGELPDWLTGILSGNDADRADLERNKPNSPKQTPIPPPAAQPQPLTAEGALPEWLQANKNDNVLKVVEVAIVAAKTSLPVTIGLPVMGALRDVQKYIRHGLLMPATEECLRIIDMAPQYLEVHPVLSEIYVLQGRVELAITKYAILVDTYIVNDRVDDAIATYRRIIELAPNTLVYRERLNNLLAAQGKNKEVFRVYPHNNVEQPVQPPVMASGQTPEINYFAFADELPNWLTGISSGVDKGEVIPKPNPIADDELSDLFSSNQLPANTILKGRYRIVERLGKGGMGAVYKARDTTFDEHFVAVKQMMQGGLAPQMLKVYTDIFKREANLLARLKHPSLPRIYDHFLEGECWYLVMDYIEGNNLQKQLEQAGGRLSLEETLHIGIDLCTVLDYLHSRQPPIVFRDLKPANVMRTPEGHLYLIDFGIARQFKPEQLQDTHNFQTVGYAAPEQFNQKQTTPQSDVYSLGATLHQLLSGNNPSDTPFDFAPLQVGVPGLEMLVRQMVEIKLANRPANMEFVKQVLQRILMQVQSSAKPQRRPAFTLEDLQAEPDWSAAVLSPPPRKSAQSRTAYLDVIEGKELGRRYEVHKEATSIGRSLECDIILEDLAASRLHASVIRQAQDGQFALRDDGSANGTKVNGVTVQKYQTYALQEGDKIQIGGVVFSFTHFFVL